MVSNMHSNVPAPASSDVVYLRNALDWFLGFLSDDDWSRRVADIESSLKKSLQPRPRKFQSNDYSPFYSGSDRIAWYLYLVSRALYDPLNYEPIQGARVLPIFHRLGRNLGELKEIGGVKGRVQRLLSTERAQPDSGLFELIIALLWKRNGYRTVEYILENPQYKTPDFIASSEREEWFVECKRLRKSSEYSEQERDKWLTMWSRFAQYLVANEFPLVFEITFHVELQSLPDDYLVDQLARKLPLLSFPCHIVSNDIWDVAAKPVDYRRIHAHLGKCYVRISSDQMGELLTGYRDPRRGLTCVIAGKTGHFDGTVGNHRFLDKLKFAACTYWNCDAPQAISRKSRDVLRQLSRAVDQLPTTGKCAVHLGLETLDGPLVEEIRSRRMMNSIFKFNSGNKDLRWVYCHLFESYAPPDQMWVLDETVTHFSKNIPDQDEPIEFRCAIVPEEETSPDEVHWRRDAP